MIILIWIIFGLFSYYGFQFFIMKNRVTLKLHSLDEIKMFILMIICGPAAFGAVYVNIILDYIFDNE